MSKLSKDDIKKLAMLSRLKLTDKEVEQYQQELSAIVGYVRRLEGVDIKGLKPTSQVTGLTDSCRVDEVTDYGVTPEELLANAPNIEDNQFKVKRMIN